MIAIAAIITEYIAFLTNSCFTTLVITFISLVALYLSLKYLFTLLISFSFNSLSNLTYTSSFSCFSAEITL